MGWGKVITLLFTLTLVWQVQASGFPKPQVNSAQTSTPPANLASVNIQPVTSPDLGNVSTDLVTVKRVVDGDTIELESGTKVRYIGINAPETVDPRTVVQCFGVEASNANKALVDGKQVRLAKDISEADKYGRVLRYVWVGETFVNDYLVRQGFATVSTYPPDVKYQQQFIQAQQEAQSSNRGLWASCNKPGASVTQPGSTGPAASKTPPDPTCPIKGNISSGGKIYHLPGQRYYNTTVIDPAAGERWFCSEQEALDAGWRKSKQ